MLEGAKRRASMCQAFQRIFSIREEYIVPVSSNFPVPKGHNANFAWNQDEVSQNSRYAKRDFTIVDSLALRQCNTSMIPDTHLLKLLFPTRYTSRSIYQSSMCDSQSASSCVLTSWMRTQECNTSMIPDTYSLKLLFLARYIPRSVYYDNSHLTYY